MFGIEQKVAKTAKRAGLLSGGLLFCAVGTAFLTMATWIALAPILGAATAALIIAAFYFGVGFILIGLGRHDRKRGAAIPEADPERAPGSETSRMIEAFMYGLRAGTQADRARR